MVSNLIAELIGRITANPKDVESSLGLGRSLCIICTCLLQVDSCYLPILVTTQIVQLA